MLDQLDINTIKEWATAQIVSSQRQIQFMESGKAKISEVDKKVLNEYYRSQITRATYIKEFFENDTHNRR